MIGDNYTINQDNYTALATKFVKGKTEPLRYIFNYDLDWIDDPMPFYHTLTKEQVEQVKAIIAECEERDIDLYEYFEENEFPEFLMPHQEDLYHIPASMELDTAYHAVKVKVAIFYDGISEKPHVVELGMVLPEQEYIELLSWQLNNREASFNDLLRNTELYKRIADNISYSLFGDHHCEPNRVPTYAVELTQIKAEAIEICGEAEINGDIYTDFRSEKKEHIFLRIKDRVLTLYFESFGEGLPYITREVINVDAMAVERALGVDSYKKLAKTLSDRFGHACGLDHFVAFLTENNIAHIVKND